MKAIFWGALVAAIVTSAGCVSSPITPAKLQAKATTDATAKAELETWMSAVELANLFLKSEYRKTLPTGVIIMDAEGMLFTCATGGEPVRVSCTTFGDLLVKCNMIAQERSWGFVVGRIKPGSDRLTANSFFRYRDGRPQGNIEVAATILHELTHLHLKMGIDDPVNLVKYYSEAIFLLRYRSHSMERLPFNTTNEFYAFVGALKKDHPDQFFAPPQVKPNPDPEPTAGAPR